MINDCFSDVMMLCRSQKVDAELVDQSLVSPCSERKKKKSISHWSPAVAHSGGAVTCLTLELTSSQQVLASAGRDQNIRVWSVINNQLLSTIVGNQKVCLTRSCTLYTSVSHRHSVHKCQGQFISLISCDLMSSGLSAL